MNGNSQAHIGGGSTGVASADYGKQSRKRLLLATLVTLLLMFAPYIAAMFSLELGKLLWGVITVALYPLRLFVTFVHESGHALAAVLSGGGVVSLHVHPNGEGVTYINVSDWWAWMSLSAGYLSTAIFGAIMLQVGRLRRLQHPGRTALYVASVAVLAITTLWGFHPFSDPFTLVTGLALSALLFALARYGSTEIANFFAAFLAVQCSLNALGDLRILLNLTSLGSEHNDAAFMTKQYPVLPPTAWAAIWAAMALIILVISLRSYWRATATRTAPASGSAVSPLG